MPAVAIAVRLGVAVTTRAATDLINHRNDDRRTMSLVVQDMRNLVLDFLFEHIEIVLAAKTTARLLFEVLTDEIHQLFAVAQIDKSTRDDVWARQQSPRTPLNRQYNHEHPLGRHVNAIFEYDF